MSCAGFEVSDQERTANPHILIRVALVIAGAPRQTAAPVSCGIELEPADEQVDYAVGIAHEPFASSNRQLIDRADGEDMLAVEVIRTVVHLRIDVGVSAIVTQVLRPGVVSNELQTVVEPLVELGLQGIVVSGCIIPEEGKILRPAVARKVGSPFIFRRPTRDTEANHGWLVRVYIRVVGVEAVTVVSDERQFSGNRVG